MSSRALDSGETDELDVRYASAPAWQRWYVANQRLALGALGILSVLVPWELAARLNWVKPVLIGSPTAVLQAAIIEVQLGTLWADLGATLQVLAIGYLAAAVVGIIVGLTAGWYRRVSYVANSWLNFVYAAPDLAFVPMFILWFGIGVTFKVWLVFLAALFFVAINTMAGVHATEARFLEVAHTYGADRLQVFRTVVLPGSVPYIITGLRQGAARAVVGVVVAEFVSSNQGIGFMISVAGSTLNTPRVMFGVMLLAALGILTGEALRRIEARFEAWRPEVHHE